MASAKKNVNAKQSAERKKQVDLLSKLDSVLQDSSDPTKTLRHGDKSSSNLITFNGDDK